VQKRDIPGENPSKVTIADKPAMTRFMEATAFSVLIVGKRQRQQADTREPAVKCAGNTFRGGAPHSEKGITQCEVIGIVQSRQ